MLHYLVRVLDEMWRYGPDVLRMAYKLCRAADCGDSATAAEADIKARVAIRDITPDMEHTNSHSGTPFFA